MHNCRSRYLVSTTDGVCRTLLPRHELLPVSAERGYCAPPASGKSNLLTPTLVRIRPRLGEIQVFWCFPSQVRCALLVRKGGQLRSTPPVRKGVLCGRPAPTAASAIGVGPSRAKGLFCPLEQQK